MFFIKSGAIFKKSLTAEHAKIAGYRRGPGSLEARKLGGLKEVGKLGCREVG